MSPLSPDVDTLKTIKAKNNTRKSAKYKMAFTIREIKQFS